MTNATTNAAQTPQEFFGENHAKIREFEKMLEEEGVLRGLIGPREVERIFTRHILNSAAVAQEIRAEKGRNDSAVVLEEGDVPRGTIVDVGSGGGFPGIVVAIMMPDYRVYLVESMLRRTDWLNYCVEKLNLKNTTVVRARAEDAIKSKTIPKADFVTARAVAPLKRLVGWTAPFLKRGGKLITLKGASVDDEIAEAQKEIKQFRLTDCKVMTQQALGESATLFVATAG